MAYYRTLKNGERRLIYTKADRAKQEERANLRRNYPPAKIVSVYVPNIWHNKDWDRAAIEHFWKPSKKSKTCSTNAARWHSLTCSVIAVRSQALKHGPPPVNVEASPGYIAHDRVITDSVAHRR